MNLGSVVDAVARSPAARGVARHGVAAFVAFHLFAVTFCALPSVGGGMNRTAWKQPTVQGEFQAWTDKFNRWGWAITEPELEDQLWAFAVAYEKGRAVVLVPLEKYFDTFGTWQSWKMFVAPHRFPARMQIEVQRPQPDGKRGDWELVYESRSAEQAWMAQQFDHDRFRAALFRYEWEHYKNARREFVDWVARRAAEDFPDATNVRVSFLRYRSPPPEDVRAGLVPETKRELAQSRDLRSVRAKGAP